MYLLEDVVTFATKKHEGQFRKYTDNVPYITHPLAVADLVAEHYRLHDEVAPTDVLAAAILHDVVEDTDCAIEEIEQLFGKTVALYVWYLTKPNPVIGKEAVKAIYDHQLATAPVQAKIIKFFDIKHNYENLDQVDPKWFEQKRAGLYDRLKVMKLEFIGGLLENNIPFYRKMRGL